MYTKELLEKFSKANQDVLCLFGSGYIDPRNGALPTQSINETTSTAFDGKNCVFDVSL